MITKKKLKNEIDALRQEYLEKLMDMENTIAFLYRHPEGFDVECGIEWSGYASANISQPPYNYVSTIRWYDPIKKRIMSQPIVKSDLPHSIIDAKIVDYQLIFRLKYANQDYTCIMVTDNANWKIIRFESSQGVRIPLVINDVLTLRGELV